MRLIGVAAVGRSRACWRRAKSRRLAETIVAARRDCRRALLAALNGAVVVCVVRVSACNGAKLFDWRLWRRQRRAKLSCDGAAEHNRPLRGSTFALRRYLRRLHSAAGQQLAIIFFAFVARVGRDFVRLNLLNGDRRVLLFGKQPND